MKKIIFLFVMVFANFTQVNASTVTQTFEEVFITCESDEGDKVVTAINVIELGSDYLYKLYLGDVTNYFYEEYEESIIKYSIELLLNEVVYFEKVLNTEDETKWYYIAQYLIYDYIYSDDIYFSDSNGNEIEFLAEELKTFYSTINSRYYAGQTIKIYNNEVLEIKGTLTGSTSYTSYKKVDDGYKISINSGSYGYLNLVNYYNEDQNAVYYSNSDNNVLFAGGGEFFQSDTIRVELETTSSVAADNPATGVNPYISLFIGIPVIILGGIIVYVFKENKEKKLKKANKM